MTSSSDSISVAVRVRPPKDENDVEEWMVQDQVIYAARPECQQNVFAFDHILSQEKTNADVYDQVVHSIITSVMAGYHGTVFAYGQTSSGKTHTMMGNDQDPGVIKRAIAQIFDNIHKATDREFLIRISYLEIYNEQIRDLLNTSSSANLQIKGPDMAVAGLTEQVTTDAEQIFHYMTEGDKNRHVGCTNMNERSSRSHSIFRITIESSNRNSETNKRDGVRISQLNLVDLAGSERATHTGATGTRLREGCHINTSLTALGIVIRKLSTGEKHINFRDSKLTRILQNSLGGNSRTAIICNISPSDYETSLSTLRFGSDAKRITNKPVINQVLAEDASLLRKRNKEIESLKALISKVETGKEQQLKEKDDTIDKLRKKIEGLQKLAIGGELPSSVSDRNASASRRTDTRRRETWCPGQIAATATPAKSAMLDLTSVHNDSFIARYGAYREEFDFCTPARPRKRKSEEAFPKTEAKTTLREEDSTRDENAPPNLREELEEARLEIESLREELEFLRNEKGLYCGGSCTPAAKRVCLDSRNAATPIPEARPDLSQIPEEESELEEDSPFGTKLKIMATPRQKIQGMRLENRMLKRTLMVSSSCSTPAPSEDTVMTLCNRSVPTAPEAKPEMSDAACQCEELNHDEEERTDAVPETHRRILVDASTSPEATIEISSPAFDTPLRTLQRVCRDSIPLIDLDANFIAKVLQVSRRDAETSICGLALDIGEAETTDETLRDQTDQTELGTQTVIVPCETVERSEVEVQTDTEPVMRKAEKADAESQAEVSTFCCEIQASVATSDAETSVPIIASEDASTQTSDGKVCPTDVGRGLDAILGDSEKDCPKVVKTHEVGVQVRFEELWVIKMKLEQEKMAREEAEQKLDDVWKERTKVVNTNDKYLEYFKAHGIDPISVIKGQVADTVGSRKGNCAADDVDALKKKYDALKEFCFRHPDIKERVLKDKVIVRHTPQSKNRMKENDAKIHKETVAESENLEPSTSGNSRPGATDRPLAELQDMQQFKGTKYLAEADPGECKPS
ncbi:centromere-associated protein E [Galendromus occidentalis]|uniref:Centromere-associated protein E n=1 Tax=Galendromus occidentalis TaxID=34638 RepID=A0AAJ7WHZ0_9ACAR|nr:centromere-associated protein E [Galendromus occidentalis]